jgi:hypothetical protein
MMLKKRKALLSIKKICRNFHSPRSRTLAAVTALTAPSAAPAVLADRVFAVPNAQNNLHQSWPTILGSLRATGGGFFPSKISGVGTILGLLVHVLPGSNKQRARNLSLILS